MATTATPFSQTAATISGAAATKGLDLVPTNAFLESSLSPPLICKTEGLDHGDALQAPRRNDNCRNNKRKAFLVIFVGHQEVHHGIIFKK
jgi:hypothetical protein